jgi:hypothetical protein
MLDFRVGRWRWKVMGVVEKWKEERYEEPISLRARKAHDGFIP